jgi:hypothetical protein
MSEITLRVTRNAGFDTTSQIGHSLLHGVVAQLHSHPANLAC